MTLDLCLHGICFSVNGQVGKATFQEEMQRAKTLCTDVPERLSHPMCRSIGGMGDGDGKGTSYLSCYSQKNCPSALKCFSEKWLTTSCRVIHPPTSAPLVIAYYHVLILHLHLLEISNIHLIS